MNESKIIIIGANGYIGRHLAKLLQGNCADLKLYDLQPQPASGPTAPGSGSTDPEAAPFYAPLDILDKNTLAGIDWDVNAVFMMAGLTGTSAGFTQYETFINSNEIGLLNVLDQLRKNNSKARVVFPSSRLVYKGQKDRLLKEEDEKEFKTVYALNKFACENYLKMY
ncbi:MAG: NAD(P)-dependent oxidoreductase, partial [bacterium]|nr:NAD(P)-dependent oxidoreductase [bacterium]